jgi:hypothetical protein
MAAKLMRAIELLADRRPHLLKNRDAAKVYLVAVAKINDIKQWQTYNQLIETLLDEFCVT